MTDAEDMKAVFDLLSTPVDYTKETQPATTTAPKTEPEAEEEYYPEEEYSPRKIIIPKRTNILNPIQRNITPGTKNTTPKKPSIH